jgi:hypothetical protein
VYQVTMDFHDHYCSASEVGSIWDPDISLFALWIGINELAFLILRQITSPLTYGLYSVQFSYLEPHPYVIILQVLESYFRLIQELYRCGARRFLIINVPPTTRTPKMLSSDRWLRRLHEKVLHEFNRQLAQAVRVWRGDLDSVSVMHTLHQGKCDA